MSLLSRGSSHQGHEGFSGQSRGKLCSFMSLSALLTAQAIPVTKWNSTTIDNVLEQGDNMYLNAFNHDLIPHEGFLPLNNLPTVVCCHWLDDNVSCRSVIDTNISPVEAQKYIIDHLPIVVEPVETQNKNQVWFINYGKDHQGLIINSEHEVEDPYFTIRSALMNTFTNNNYAILILEGYMMALIKGLDYFYLFDPHARNCNGMPDPNGTAVVMKCDDLIELEQYLCSLSSELRTNLFEIVPVELHVNQFCNNLEEAESEKHSRLEKDKKYQKRKRSEETEIEKQTRLENIRKSQKRRRSAETDSEKQARLEKARESQQQKRSAETDSQKQARLEKARKSQQQKRLRETESEKQARLEKARIYQKRQNLSKKKTSRESSYS